jgi:hypothetical protein
MVGPGIGTLEKCQSSSVLLSVLLAACAVSNPKGSTSIVPEMRERAIVSAECYGLSYSDAVGSASVLPFPTWLMLLPGGDVGSAVGRPAAGVDDRAWAGLSKHHGWKRISSDSLEVMFTGSFEGIRIHVVRTGANLIGRATWLTDILGLPESSMRLNGNREPCPENVSPATCTGMLPDERCS